MMQDKTGILWVGTRGGGISCFDGKVFKTITTEDIFESDMCNNN